MAYHRLGDTAKSCERSDKAKFDDKTIWEQRLLYRRLRQEAAELLKADAKPMR